MRIDSKEMEGLFRKKGGADRYLVCLTRARVDSGRPIWIMRLGRDSARGRRRRVTGSSPALADLAIQSMVRPKVWLRSTRTTRVVHLRRHLGTRWLGAGCSAVRAARRGGVSPSQGVRGVPVWEPGCRGVVGEQGNAWVLTGPWKREERRCRGVDGEDRRRVAGGARGRAAVEVRAESNREEEAATRRCGSAARPCDGARAEMEGGGGRPEEGDEQ